MNKKFGRKERGQENESLKQSITKVLTEVLNLKQTGRGKLTINITQDTVTLTTLQSRHEIEDICQQFSYKKGN